MKLKVSIATLCAGLSLNASAQQAESYIVLDSVSGKVLFGKNTEVKRPVASLTKIATAKLVLDWAKLTQTPLTTKIMIPASATTVSGSNPLALSTGDTISLRDALYSCLLGSDNVAAHTIANYVGFELLKKRAKQGEPLTAFVDEMNKLAKSIGMKRSKFVNPHGLDGNKSGISTASDIARLSMAAMLNDGLGFMVKQKQRQVSVNKSDGKVIQYQLTNTNQLLGKQGVIGLKTGLTSAAGQCLATIATNKPIVFEQDGKKLLRPRQLVVVLLGSRDRFKQTSQLITQGWIGYDKWGKDGYLLAADGKDVLRLPQTAQTSKPKAP